MATFEHATTNGEVTDELIRIHQELSAGGVGLTIVAYCSVAPEGATMDGQIILDREHISGLRKLSDAVHKEGGAICLQLTHAGYFSHSSPVGMSSVFCPANMTWPKVLTDGNILSLIESWGESAWIAKESGADAIEVHCAHGYLLSQAISPYTNRRTDRWGGSLENRMRFPLAVLKRIRERVGQMTILVKMNLTDGVEGGLTVDESILVAQMFEQSGFVDLIVLSGGFTSKNGFYMLRGPVPLWELRSMRPWWLGMGALLTGRWTIPALPYTPLFFKDDAQRVREAVKLPLVYQGGAASLADANALLDEHGFEFVGMARALLREPDLCARAARGGWTDSLCTHCNLCVGMMDGILRCPLRTEVPEW